ncbi:hypothetical protein K8352_15870 [Flavobacteriaceae bacterium F89]|uniref:Beta-galactosidase n=1 Tax=Cerina litoralis TaxID=2874477 RepID=A0AAE3JS96_9FLAO|nr:sugar-binding domain-containing protein [Cerina litoralis]MCG2462238.1 hypothetical protein [Cerina litoralis]
MLELKKFVLGLGVFLFGIYPTFSQEEEPEVKDIFEQIALQKREDVPGLEKNLPQILPNLILKWDNSPNKAFKPGKTISTRAGLDKELLRMRKKYAPFMRDLTPPLPVIRKRTQLKTFQRKLMATEMGMDGNGNVFPLKELVSVAKENTWEEVNIPHYSGPINSAEAHYRKTLNIKEKQLFADKLFLHFNGVDYKCEVYLNGQKVGTHVGLFGAFEFDIKPYAKLGRNLLLVKVFNESIMMGDSFFIGPERKFGKKLAACGGMGWDEPGLAKGWTMCPPGFGIWQRCYLETRNDAFINDLFVRPILEENKIEIQVELPNTIADTQIGFSLYGQNFKTTITENQHAKKTAITPSVSASGFTTYTFTASIPKDQLRLWSPETPWLYQLQVQIKQENVVVDVAKQQFGMRSFIQSETSTPKGRFYLNSKEIKLRGANMMGNIMQCIFRNDYDQLRDDILLAKIVGMNFWRMTQQPNQKEAYEYFDKLGLLAQIDMPAFNGYRKDAINEVKPQFIELLRMVRSHPCNAIISYLNEPDFNKPMMLDRKGHENLFTRFDAVARLLNPNQVTKWVEGDYLNLSQKFSDHHVYNTWYGNSMRSEYFGHWPSTRAGWMHGCGEFGAEGLNTIPFMRKYYPKEWLKLDHGSIWNPRQIPRCQTQDIGGKWMHLTDSTMTDWVSNSREFQKWATRLFTETLRRDPKMNSFAIHLLIDAWPAGWLKAIMDSDRQAKPAYFAYREALKPIAVNLRPNSFYGFSGDIGKVAVFICNDTPKSISNAKLRYQVEANEGILYTGRSQAVIPSSNPKFQGWLEIPFPKVKFRQNITVRVGLFNEEGRLIDDSAYDLEILPTSDKNKDIDFPGGYPQRLIK